MPDNDKQAPQNASAASTNIELQKAISKQVESVITYMALYARDIALTGEMKADEDIDLFHQEKTDALLALFREYETRANKYHELIMAVGNKTPGETRHQTALRYIKQAEESDDTAIEEGTS